MKQAWAKDSMELQSKCVLCKSLSHVRLFLIICLQTIKALVCSK